MIWDRKLVHCIEGYEFRQSVDPLMVAAAGAGNATNPLLEHLSDKMWHALAQATATWAVDIDRQDVCFDVHTDKGTGLVVARVRWRPSTTAILLIDGPMDGAEYVVTSSVVRQPVNFALAPGRPRFEDFSADDTVPAAHIEQVTYWWHGWHEDERKWTYSIAT